jgi:hypothetical protein
MSCTHTHILYMYTHICVYVCLWLCFLAVVHQCSYFYFEPQVRAPRFFSLFWFFFKNVNGSAVVHALQFWGTCSGLGVVKSHLFCAKHEDVWGCGGIAPIILIFDTGWGDWSALSTGHLVIAPSLDIE